MKNLNKEYGKEYFNNYGNASSSYEKQINNPTFNKRLNEIGFLGVKRGKILDIGCAYGYFLRACEGRGFETFGIDISKHAIKVAKKNCKANLNVVDVSKSKIPYKNSYFDVVILMDVLEHMENPYLLLNEVFRILKKGGLVYIHVPLRERALIDKTHKTFFSIDSLIKVMSNFSFKVQKNGEEGGRFSDILAVFRLVKNRNTYFNYVPEGTGSFISAYFRKV